MVGGSQNAHIKSCSFDAHTRWPTGHHLVEGTEKVERTTEHVDTGATWRRWMAGRSFTPRANHGMFSAQSGDISLKEHKPVCC